MRQPNEGSKSKSPTNPAQGPGYRPIGRVSGAFGVHGLAKVQILTDFLERFDVGSRVRIGDLDTEIVESGIQNGKLMVKFDGIDTPEQVKALGGQKIETLVTARPELEKDEFLTSDLIGLKVITAQGDEIGNVDDVLPLPAHDVLVVGQVMIPAVKAFVKKIDLKTGTIKVKLIPGMLPEED